MSKSRPSDLPDFRKPPLVEVALSLQFEAVDGLTTAHIGLLWKKYRSQLPLIEEHPPLDPAFEKFDPPRPKQVEIRFGNKPPVPRVWFLSEAKTEVLQIQHDRFIHNWRKVGDGATYPRYEQIRDQFWREAQAFARFLSEEKLGLLSINQCEITYVNHVGSETEEVDFGKAENLVANWQSLTETAFLPKPEEVSLNWRYRMPDDVGRLHVMVRPVWNEKEQRFWTMSLMARGRPAGEGLERAFEFFDLGREWIVRGFTDLTTESMHSQWERIDVSTK